MSRVRFMKTDHLKECIEYVLEYKKGHICDLGKETLSVRPEGDDISMFYFHEDEGFEYYLIKAENIKDILAMKENTYLFEKR